MFANTFILKDEVINQASHQILAQMQACARDAVGARVTIPIMRSWLNSRDLLISHGLKDPSSNPCGKYGLALANAYLLAGAQKAVERFLDLTPGNEAKLETVNGEQIVSLRSGLYFQRWRWRQDSDRDPREDADWWKNGQ